MKSPLKKIRIDVAKRRIRFYEYLAFRDAGYFISPYSMKALELRKKYGRWRTGPTRLITRPESDSREDALTARPAT